MGRTSEKFICVRNVFCVKSIKKLYYGILSHTNPEYKARVMSSVIDIMNQSMRETRSYLIIIKF